MGDYDLNLVVVVLWVMYLCVVVFACLSIDLCVDCACVINAFKKLNPIKFNIAYNLVNLFKM